jgi:hypothetical protein
MTVLAKGAEQVKRLEYALRGGELPPSAIEDSKAQLQRYVTERFQMRKERHAERIRLTRRRREKLLAHVSMEDPGIQQEMQESRVWFETHRKHGIAKPIRQPRKRREPFVVAGSFELFRNPPYDNSFSLPPFADLIDDSSTVVASGADASNGTYNVTLYSEGQGPQSCAAGVCVSFVAPPAFASVQTFNALLVYDFLEIAQAQFFTADNELATGLWVWGVSENAWVGQANISPSWSDHDSWLGISSNEGTNVLHGGTVFFETVPSGNYVAWVWSSAYVSADGGSGFGGISTLQMDAFIEYVSFSEVFIFPP